MAFARSPNVRLADVYYFTEATAGTGPTTEAVNRIRFTTMTMQTDEEESVVEEAGDLFPADVEKHSASYSGSLSMLFRHGDPNPILKAAFRDSAGLPAEVTATPVVSFINSVADIDGVSRPALKVVGSNGGFDALKAASSQALCGGLWVIIEDAATANNNSATIGPKLVTPGNPRDSGADTLLSLDLRSFQGGAAAWGGGDGANGWDTEDTLDTITLKIGAGLVPNAAPASGTGTYSLTVRFNDVATPMYQELTGVIFGAPSLTWNDRGHLMWEIPYVGYDLVPVSDTVTTSGSFTDGTLGAIAPRGGSGVTKLALLTDTQVITLEGDDVSSPTTAIEGGAELVKNTIGGTTPAAWTLSGYTANFGFDWLVKGEATSKAEVLAALGHRNTRERVTFYVEFTDPDTNVISLTFLEAAPATALVGTVGGGNAPATGTSTATVCQRPANGVGNTWPGVAYQVWSAA